ncbi:DUF3144 domain-containing protein [Duganella aquatilis]|uniref:DUF3144 domain-containing protein n=1 Tax=Duganella aquatilis TaxID=2666082 RepID=UPI001AA03DAC
MHQQTDDHFYNHADAHIHLANEQLSDATSGIVSASFMYAASRFNDEVPVDFRKRKICKQRVRRPLPTL